MLSVTVGNYYTFSLYPVPSLGSSFSNAKLLSIMDYDTALKFANVTLQATQSQPYLPTGTPSDYKNFTYYLFLVDGKKIVIADYWIITTSLVVSQNTTSTIRLNNISSTDLTTVQEQLRLLGISFDILS